MQTPPECLDDAEFLTLEDGTAAVKYNFEKGSILLTEGEYMNWRCKRDVLRQGKSLMFEGAKFGDHYLTRDNREAIFQCECMDCVTLFTEHNGLSIRFDGTDFFGESTNDIVKKID